MSKKRLLSIVISAVILLSFACTAMAAEKSERYVGDSTVNGSIYQTYYQVDAQTRTGVKKISVSGVLYRTRKVFFNSIFFRRSTDNHTPKLYQYNCEAYKQPASPGFS